MNPLPRLLALVLLIVSLLPSSGCLIAMQVTKSQDRKNLAQVNLEREKSGLKPLTLKEYQSPR